MKYNFHTHTKRCGHAVGEDEEYIVSAINNNYKVLGISDHNPYRNMSVPLQRMEWNDYSNYLDDIKKLKNKYNKDIKMYIGLECEYYPTIKDDLIELSKYCDYMILGQHHYLSENGTQVYKTQEELTEMTNCISEGMRSNLFLYLAHPDYYLITRPVWDELAIKICHTICKASLKYDVPLEINCNGIVRKKELGIEIGYPYSPFWKIVGEYGCKVCYGVDAHNPNRFSIDYQDEIGKLVKDNNLNIISSNELEIRIGGANNERTV